MDFATYYTTYRREIDGTINKILSQLHVPLFLREDTFADCLLKAVEIWPRFDSSRGFKFITFAYRHFAGVTIAALRQHFRQSNFAVNFSIEGSESCIDDYSAPGSRFTEEILIIPELVSKLPLKEREAITDHFFLEKPVAKIASELGLTIPAIRYRLKAGIRKLEEQLISGA
jgi:RNA polymerase sigma factor (sigma-70 family)